MDFTAKLAAMSPEELAGMPDKKLCAMAGYANNTLPNFRQELNRRGLSYGMCCYRDLLDRCNAQFVPVKGEVHALHATDDVELVMEGETIERPHIRIGKLVDKWYENLKPGVNTYSSEEYNSAIFQELLTVNGRKLVPQAIVTERFEQDYRKKAMEIGADAVLVTFTRVSVLSGAGGQPMSVIPSPYGPTVVTMSATGTSFEIDLVAVKYK
ncbi:MAG: hypothetical protein WBO37_03740 [Gammaproteobacteria bacterium]